MRWKFVFLLVSLVSIPGFGYSTRQTRFHSNRRDRIAANCSAAVWNLQALDLPAPGIRWRNQAENEFEPSLVSMSKIRFFRDSSPESKNGLRFESESESESFVGALQQSQSFNKPYRLMQFHRIQSSYWYLWYLEIQMDMVGSGAFKKSDKNFGLFLEGVWKTRAIPSWGLLHEIPESGDQGFESQILESRPPGFESHKSNDKLRQKTWLQRMKTCQFL